MIQDYDLLNQIGEGSFGRVYKARRRYTGRLVAIKLINKLGQSEDDLLSLRREIDLLRKVDHPNIMRMLDVFETETNVCIVSELARGDLFQVIDDSSTLPEAKLKSIAAQLVSSLAHLHKYKIIHRDMKPQNILVSSKGAIKICDFGFARALSQTTLVLTSVKGTPLYMAPELVQEQPYTESIDIWSLGVILYELYHGTPPYYTESIYKLIQMIVNNPIEWPKPISEEFKSFLMSMLQKDPEQRASAEDLLKHPFIADVQMQDFDDAVYRYKSNQFEEAIAKSLSANGSFKPKKSMRPDYQMMFLSPSSYNKDDLVSALDYLLESEQQADSPLIASFVVNFPQFVKNFAIIDYVMDVAMYVLNLDREKFGPQLATGLCLLGQSELPPSCLAFFTSLLTLQYCISLIQNEEPPISDIQLSEREAEKLRDRLVSFLFNGGETSVNAITFIAYLLQVNTVFIKAVCGSFAAQLVPTITASIINDPSPIAKSAAFSILARIVEQNPASVKFIQPFGEFLKTIKGIVDSQIADIETLCVFSALVSFIAVAIDPLTAMPEFQKKFGVRESGSTHQDFVEYMFSGKQGLQERLNLMLILSSQLPATDEEIMCFIGMLSSPFLHIALKEEFLDTCVNYAPNLLPVHQASLLQSIFNCISKEEVIERLPEMSPLLGFPSSTEILSQYALDVMTPQLAGYMLESGALLAISGAICDLGPSVPTSTVFLLVNIILSFREANPLLLEQSKEILNSVFSLENAAESGLLIAAHFSRLSSAFVPSLSECGALNLAERMLLSDIPTIRGRALDFIGNFSKHGPLPDDFIDNFVQLLVGQVECEDPVCEKMACFALSNVLFHSPDFVDTVCEVIEDTRLIKLLQSKDPKTVENAAGVCGNLVRRSGKRVNYLIDIGVVSEFIRVMKQGGEVGNRVCMHLSSFCQYEEARSYLNRINATTVISQYTRSQNERVKRIATSIINSL